MSKLDILFICTGNIFRSMTAEYALRAAAGPGSTYSVRSAGLIDAPHDIVPFVIDFMMEKDLDISRHQPTKLSKEILGNVDLAVAMDIEHQRHINQKYARHISLFSTIAYGTDDPIVDVCDRVADWRDNEIEARAYGRSVMNYIFDGIPGFIRRLPSFLKA